MIGHVRVKGLVGRDRKHAREIELLVDTAAFYTIIPPSAAKELGVEAYQTAPLTLADKRQVEAGISLAYMKFLDRDGVLPVAIMASPEPLLGVTVLERLGLRVDPTTGELQHSRPYGLAAL